MSEMVERVARALQAEAGRHDLHIGWELRNALARAAIAAMREPTESMKIDYHYEDIWKEMIDAALK